MKLITRDTDYAVRALCYIASSGRDLVSVTEMTRKTRIPKPFLRKILQELARNKLVLSCRGIGGGFRLAHNPDSIYLVDVVRAFQGPMRVNECVFKKSLCPNRSVCALKKRLDGIEKHVISEMSHITIKDLIK